MKKLLSLLIVFGLITFLPAAPHVVRIQRVHPIVVHHPIVGPQYYGRQYHGHTYAHYCYNGAWRGYTYYCWVPQYNFYLYWCPLQSCWYRYIPSAAIFVPCDNLTILQININNIQINIDQ